MGGNQIQLPRVTVYGTRIYPASTNDLWFSTTVSGLPWLGSHSEEAFERYLTFIENLQELGGTGTDTRILCTVKGKTALAATVSTADSVARRDAVSALVGLYNVRWTASMVWARLMGQTSRIAGQEFITQSFVFADGGTEVYYINAMSTDNARPVPGSLHQGDGVPKNVPCT